MLMALYKMLKALIQYYQKFVHSIQTIRLVNSYDLCMANQIMNGKQHNVMWHINNIELSHEDAMINNNFYIWFEKKYGSNNVRHVKVVKGKKHN